MNERIVAKFGGTSMGSPDSVRQVIEILNSDRRRDIVVVSAPGRSPSESEKVTDRLLRGDIDGVIERFLSMGQALGWEGRHFASKQARRKFDSPNPEEGIAVGEWLSANMLADLTGAQFVDAVEVIKVRQDGSVKPDTYDLIAQRFRGGDRFVVPGFYGELNGRVKTFDRGGSDITASILTVGAGAVVHENWTDIDGLRAADPRIIKNPKVIPVVTYTEMREMAQRGTEVLQADAITPVVDAGIPINIRNTFNFNPEERGTFVQSSRDSRDGETVIGIAGKPDMMAFQISQHGLNDQIGVGAEVLGIFGRHGVSYEQDPSGKDNMTVLVSQKDVNGNERGLREDLAVNLPGARVSTIKDLALVSVVGQNIRHYRTEVLASTFNSLLRAGIEVTTVDFGAAGNNVVMSVRNADLNKSTEVLYSAFIDPRYSSK